MMQFEEDRRSRAEQLVLSAMLRDNGCVRHLAHVTPAAFSHDTHGQIFRVMRRMIEAGEKTNTGTVYEALYRERRIRGVGLMAYLMTLLGLPANPASVGYYASFLCENAPPWAISFVTGRISDPGHAHCITDPGHTYRLR